MRAFTWAGGSLFVTSLAFGVFRYAAAFGQVAGDASSALPAVLADVVLFSLFAAHHSRFARTGLKARMQALVSPQLERSVYVWLASVLFMLVCASWRPVPGEWWRIP